jgi:maltose O-acetyltransferase
LPLRAPVFIGENTFIGVGAMILPGVSIGRECIIGAGAVVTKSIPDNSVAVGVPAKVVETGVTMKFGAIRATV